MKSASDRNDTLAKLTLIQLVTAQELRESRGGRHGLPVPNSPYGLCGRKATLNSITDLNRSSPTQSSGAV